MGEATLKRLGSHFKKPFGLEQLFSPVDEVFVWFSSTVISLNLPGGPHVDQLFPCDSAPCELNLKAAKNGKTAQTNCRFYAKKMNFRLSAGYCLVHWL
jgi:hypothetical protein